jgi:hypothetical protein
LELKNDVNIPSKSNKQKTFVFKLAFCWRLKVNDKKIAGSESGSGSNSQRNGSEDPDQHQNVMDPEQWFEMDWFIGNIL